MNHNFEIYTDGSGHKNGFGGWAALITTPDRTFKHFKMGAASGTSVDRMEFTAFLEGLQGVWEVAQRMREAHQDDWKPSVLWFTDRESLLNSVKRLNARSNCPDLWCQFDFFEQRMSIEPCFVTEAMVKTLMDFREVDLQSSVGYQMLKNYLTSKPFSPTFDYER